MKISQLPSSNFGPRAADKKPYILVLHYTDTPTAKEALDLMRDPKHQASAHYLVDTDGSIIQLVNEDKRAWHAGKSWWQGEEDINSCSIGIEVQNPGHGHGYVPFPKEQMLAVRDLCKTIIQRHSILPRHVLAHSDVAPARKTDPGELFPWEWLASEGVGLWPASNGEERGDLKKLLEKHGYDPRLDEKTLLTAFQRHFEPEVFKAPEKIGLPTPDTLPRLNALLNRA